MDQARNSETRTSFGHHTGMLEKVLSILYCAFLVLFAGSLGLCYVLLLFDVRTDVAERILGVDLRIIRAAKEYWVAAIVLLAPLFLQTLRDRLAHLKEAGPAKFYEPPPLEKQGEGKIPSAEKKV